MKDYVLITGPTSGIGYEFAKIYAQKGENLILVARRENELKNIKEKFEKTYNIEVKIFSFDLSKISKTKEFCNKIKDERIKILINNAGFGIYGEFLDLHIEKIEEMINLNITSLTILSKVIGEKMAKLGGGKIINIASTASFFPGPYLALYYGTKAFVLSLSESLSVEFKKKNVIVLALCPGPTKTNFAKVANMGSSKLFKSFNNVSAKDVAKYGVLSLEKNKVIAIHKFKNKILIFLGKLIPRRFNRYIVGKIQKTRKNM